MKLAVDDRSIDRIGIGSETTYKIKASAKAFRVLSSNLYKDKILAIVREISCNAFDAQVAAGTQDRPFDVHLPNNLEPYFSIRDYGTGLSHDDVVTLYSTYFDSTKTDSNDFIGALGLGSKSPYSYVDAFTVSSYFNGVKSSYACFKNEEGIPTTTRMGVENTNLPNGLEVTVAVEKREDFSVFLQRAKDIYLRFEPTPNVTGNASFDKVARTAVMERPGSWRLYKMETRNTNAVAIMGRIAYPIDVNSLPGVTNDIAAILGTSIDINFALGDLDFTAGREELSYDAKHTVPALMRRLKEVRAEIIEELNTQMAKCSTIFEASGLYGDLVNTGIFYSLFQTTSLKWRDKTINSSHVDLDISVEKVVIQKLSFGKTVRRTTMDHSLYVECSPRTVFFKKDSAQTVSSRTRIAEYRKSHTMNDAVLVEGSPGDIAVFEARLPGFTFIDVMSLPTAASTPKTARVKTKFKATSNGRPDLSRYIEVDLEDGGFYVLMSNQKIKDGTPIDKFAAKWNALAGMDCIPSGMAVVVAPTSISNKLVAHPKWIDVQKWMEEVADITLSNPDVTDKIERATSFKRILAKKGDYTLKELTKKLSWIKLPQNHPLQLFTEEIETQRSLLQSGDKIAKLINAFATINVSEKDVTGTSLLDAYERLLKDYPFIDFAPEKFFSASPVMQNYIDMVDRDKAAKKIAQTV